MEVGKGGSWLQGLWPERRGPTPFRHQPLSSRWLTVIRWAALRPMTVMQLAVDGKQAGEVVTGGGAQSRSLVVG